MSGSVPASVCQAVYPHRCGEVYPHRCGGWVYPHRCGGGYTRIVEEGGNNTPEESDGEVLSLFLRGFGEIYAQFMPVLCSFYAQNLTKTPPNPLLNFINLINLLIPADSC